MSALHLFFFAFDEGGILWVPDDSRANPGAGAAHLGLVDRIDSPAKPGAALFAPLPIRIFAGCWIRRKEVFLSPSVLLALHHQKVAIQGGHLTYGVKKEVNKGRTLHQLEYSHTPPFSLHDMYVRSAM